MSDHTLVPTDIVREGVPMFRLKHKHTQKLGGLVSKRVELRHGSWVHAGGELVVKGKATISSTQVYGKLIVPDGSKLTACTVTKDCDGFSERRWLFDYTISSSVYFVNWLPLWDVTITNGFITIGCQRHSLKAWMKFSDQRIDSMSDDALAWWRAHKHEVTHLHHYHFRNGSKPKYLSFYKLLGWLKGRKS